MRLETPFLALLIGSLFFTGLFTVFMGVANTYDVNYDLTTANTQGNVTRIQDAFNRINETKTQMDETNEEFEVTILKQTDSSDLFPFFSLALNIGKNMYSSLSTFKDILNIFVELTGIPSAFVITFFVILTSLFVLSVIFLLLGRTI